MLLNVVANSLDTQVSCVELPAGYKTEVQQPWRTTLTACGPHDFQAARTSSSVEDATRSHRGPASKGRDFTLVPHRRAPYSGARLPQAVKHQASPWRNLQAGTEDSLAHRQTCRRALFRLCAVRAKKMLEDTHH